MDTIVVGLLATVAIVAAVVYATREREVLPLDELLSRLTSIQADSQLTAAQKQHLCEIAYRGFQDSVVSVIGGVQDVFPNASIVMKTLSRELPLIGVELARVSPEELRAFNKGKEVTLRVKLPGWENFSEAVGLPARFTEAKLFYGGRWYGVKSTYRVRDPSEPKTGEFKIGPKTSEFKVSRMTGELKAATKTGEFKALPTDEPKRNQ